MSRSATASLPAATPPSGLQDHVKATIAPFKYPRSVLVDALPKTQYSGKIQRFRLRPGASMSGDQDP